MKRYQYSNKDIAIIDGRVYTEGENDNGIE